MIRKVTIRNYKSIAEVDVELGRFTVFIGPNGSGKSNFIDALRFLSDAVTVGLDMAIAMRQGIRGICRLGAQGVALELRFEFADETHAEYALELKWEETGEYRVARERGEGIGGTFEVCEGRFVRLPGILEPFAEKPLPPDALAFPLLGMIVVPQAWLTLKSMGFYHPLPLVIRATLLGMPTTAPQPLLEYGQNLPYVLWTLRRSHAGAFAKICEAASYLVPGLKTLDPRDPRLVGVEYEWGRRELWQESDGTLRLLALATALYQEPPLSLLAIEEPELTVHPESLGTLVDLLLERSATGQVLLTTHSPDLLNYLPAEVLRIVELENGETKIGPLAEDQRSVIEEKYFKMGDLLRIEGLRRELPT